MRNKIMFPDDCVLRDNQQIRVAEVLALAGPDISASTSEDFKHGDSYFYPHFNVDPWGKRINNAILRSTVINRDVFYHIRNARFEKRVLGGCYIESESGEWTIWWSDELESESNLMLRVPMETRTGIRRQGYKFTLEIPKDRLVFH